MKIQHPRRVCLMAISLTCLFSWWVPSSQATIINVPLTFENDMELLNSPFGSIAISDEGGLNTLTFTIDIDNSKLGPNADIQHFGFQVDGFGGSLSLSPAAILGQPIQLFVGPSNATKVSGMGNTQFDYLVDFGNGSPILDNISFILQGTTSFGLNNLNPADTILTNTGKLTNFGIHVQSTSTQPGSEALGGRWIPSQPPNGQIPEPISLTTWSVLCALAFLRRSRR